MAAGNIRDITYIVKGMDEQMNIDVSLIDQTEQYIEEHREAMGVQIYNFIRSLCVDERRMIELIQEQASQKKVFKP